MNFGLFWPNPSDTFLDIRTKEEGRRVRIVSEGGFLQLFIFVDAMKDLVHKFDQLTGAPAMPPMWAFGYHQCKWGYTTQTLVEAILANYSKFKIPLDVFWLDVDHCRFTAPFEWDHTRFPNPKAITDTLAASKRYLVRISDINLPVNAEHIQYQEAHKARYFMRLANGKDDFVGKCWPGDSSWLDLLNHSAADWYSSKHWYGEGRDFTTPNTFYWNDMNEPSIGSHMEGTIPKDARHINGLEARETHSTYGLMQTYATSRGELTRDTHAGGTRKRSFVLSRSWFAGSQRYAWAWTGDNFHTWLCAPQSLSMILVAGLNSFPFIGADLGGFSGSHPGNEELFVRWWQLGAWTYPFYRSHASRKVPRREPWLFPPSSYKRLVKSITDRYRLFGVWYTHGVYATRIGRSPVVPLWFEFPLIEAYHDLESVALVADSLLVVPVLTENATHVDVPKPPGVWYDFVSGEALAKELRKPVTLDDIPVYIRGGRIVPLYNTPGEVSIHTVTTPLTLVIAGDDNGRAHGSLYLDDGVSFSFEEGTFVERNFTYDQGTLNWVKGNRMEKHIPDFLLDAIVSNLDIYTMNPDGTSEVRHISGLKLKVCEEWKYVVPKSESGLNIGGGRGRSVLAIVSIFCGSVIVIVILSTVTVVMRRRVRDEQSLTLKNPRDRTYT
jgi:alpha 1,3-glucosidase